MADVKDLAVTEGAFEVSSPFRVLAVLPGEHALDAGDAFTSADAWHLTFVIAELASKVPRSGLLGTFDVRFEDSDTCVLVVSNDLEDPVGGRGRDVAWRGTVGVQNRIDDGSFLGMRTGHDPLPGSCRRLEDGVDVRLFGVRDDFWRQIHHGQMRSDWVEDRGGLGNGLAVGSQPRRIRRKLVRGKAR